MGKKLRSGGVNSRVAAANERKQASAAKKKAELEAKKESELAREWAQGSNTRAKVCCCLSTVCGSRMSSDVAWFRPSSRN
jgi:hypothetical protein